MKKILVAGAGHGGLSAAINLAKNGYDVIVHTFSNTEKAKELCEYLNNSYGVNASFIKADFTKDEEIKALSEKASVKS